MKINGNERRAARAESADPIEYELGFDDKGKPLTWHFKRGLPLEALDLLGENRLSEAIAMLLANPEDIDAFMDQKPEVEDLNDITEAITGADSGNSSASAKRSRRTGKR